MEGRYDHGLLKVGTCCLHQLHNAFRDATHSNEWGVGKFLTALYYLFNKVPARREEYETLTSRSEMPKKFCAHRWAENVEPAKRAIVMLPHLRTWIKELEKKKNSKDFKIPKCASFDTVKSFVSQKFAMPQLHFYVTMTKPIESFLTIYQTDAPMMPFLVKDLDTLLKELVSWVIKKSVADFNDDKILNIDFEKESNLKKKKIHIGFAASSLLDSWTEQVERPGRQPRAPIATEEEVTAFKQECSRTVMVFLKKIKKKSPISLSLARNLACFDPCNISQKPSAAIAMFHKVLVVFEEKNLVAIGDCDLIEGQFFNFVHKFAKDSEDFKEFDQKKHRLDEIWFKNLNKKQFSQLWGVVSQALVMSHGQASVERGFSTNKYCIEDNQTDDSLISRRIVKDHLHHIGGINFFVITEKLIKYCLDSRMRYRTHIASEKEKKTNEVKKERGLTLTSNH